MEITNRTAEFELNQLVVPTGNKEGNAVYHTIPLGKLCKVKAVSNILYDIVYMVQPEDESCNSQWVKETDLMDFQVMLFNQQAIVMNWLLAGGITTREAVNYAAVMSLTKIISQLRLNFGIPIESRRMKVPGSRRKVTVYEIPEKDIKWVKRCFLPIS